MTMTAVASGSLGLFAEATKTVKNAKTINCVIFMFIVAKTARVPVPTALSPQLAIGPVVRTPKELNLGFLLTIVGGLPVSIVDVEHRDIAIYLAGPRARGAAA